jgi:hypothetical protein
MSLLDRIHRLIDITYSCPHCGTPLRGTAVWKRIAHGVVTVAFIGFGVLLIVAEMWGMFWFAMRMVMGGHNG